MKIVFMGTPQFALPSLKALVKSKHKIVAVVTQEDKPRGRKLILSPSPVKLLASELGLRVLQPSKLSEPSFKKEMRTIKPDLIAVVAYGRFLPKSLWELPSKGTINLHPSLLPNYRGAAPIQHAILDGEAGTGVTIIYLAEKMDSGDIIRQEKMAILPTDTYATLSERLSEKGAKLLLGAVRDIEKGTVSRRPQDDSKATKAPKIEKSEGLIDWSLSARDISLRVRAFYPWPSAYTYMSLRGRKVLLKILEAGVDQDTNDKVGRMLYCKGEGIRIGTGKGSLIIKRVQLEGKRAMTAAEFVAGHRDLDGVKLG